MDKKVRYQELIKKRVWVLKKLNKAKKNLGHPHLDFMSAHDLAESDFNLWTAYLEDIESQIEELEPEL